MNTQEGTTQNYAIPDGVDATGWEGKAVYESAAGVARLIDNPGTRYPAGVVVTVDTLSRQLEVCIDGLCTALPGATQDFASSRLASANSTGLAVGEVEGAYKLGWWGTKAVPVENGPAEPFFVRIDGTKFA